MIQNGNIISKKIKALLLCTVLCLTMLQTPAGAAIDSAAQKDKCLKAKKAVTMIGDYVYKNFLQDGNFIPSFGDDGEYTIFTLARAGYPVKAGYFDKYYEKIECAMKALKQDGKVCISEKENKWKTLDEITITEWSKLVMAVSAIGYDPSEVGGINLVEMLCSKDKLNNSTEWMKYETALLAMLTVKEIPVSGDAFYSKEELAVISGNEIPGAISSGYIDSVAMTIQPLASFYDEEAVSGTAAYTITTNVNTALNFLENIQLETGYFNDWGTDNNPWSATQVLIALGLYGINPFDDSEYHFIKNDISIFDTMFEYIDFEKNTLADYFVSFDPVQYIRGFDACLRAIEGRNSLFDCSDAIVSGDVTGNNHVELSDANLVLKAALGIVSLNKRQFFAAEVDGKPKVTLSDANLVLKAALGIYKL